MPRGGRRPGAGAPKGNTNALRTGNHSPRTLEVYLALRVLIARNDEPRLRALIQACFDANIFHSAREIGVRHIPAPVRLLHPMLFRAPRHPPLCLPGPRSRWHVRRKIFHWRNPSSGIEP